MIPMSHDLPIPTTDPNGILQPQKSIIFQRSAVCEWPRAQSADAIRHARQLLPWRLA